MIIYIIGNGFDLHHNLKTKYSDYRDFLEQSTDLNIKCIEKLIDSRSNLSSTWSNLEESLNMDIDALKEDLLEYYPKLDDANPGWGDIGYLAQSYSDAIKNFTSNMFIQWINSIDLSSVKAFLSLNPDDYYVSFNYTDTLEKVYGISSGHILHIHGSRTSIPINANAKTIHDVIQFGSPEIDGSDMKCVYNELKDDEFYEISLSSMINELNDCSYYASKYPKNNYNSLKTFIGEHNFDTIIIMGHSFNGVDYPYYRDVLVPKFKDAHWIYMQYGKSDRDISLIRTFNKNNNISDYEIIYWRF